MVVRVFDGEGNERDLEWLEGRFGMVGVERGEAGPGWRLAELREKTGPASYVVRCEDEAGPVEGVQVARWWPGVEEVLPEELATWNERGVYGPTNENGDVGFGGGTGDYYDPAAGQRGASAFWCEGNSDCVTGIGFLVVTQHTHLDVLFVWDEGEVEPPDPPDPGDGYGERMAVALERLAVAVEALVEWEKGRI